MAVTSGTVNLHWHVGALHTVALPEPSACGYLLWLQRGWHRWPKFALSLANSA